MKGLTWRLRSWSPAVQVAREDAPLIPDVSLVLLAAARAPPLLFHFGIFVVVGEELGLRRKCRLAELLALRDGVDVLDSGVGGQRFSVGAPELDVLLNEAVLGWCICFDVVSGCDISENVRISFLKEVNPLPT